MSDTSQTDIVAHNEQISPTMHAMTIRIGLYATTQVLHVNFEAVATMSRRAIATDGKWGDSYYRRLNEHVHSYTELSIFMQHSIQ